MGPDESMQRSVTVQVTFLIYITYYLPFVNPLTTFHSETLAGQLQYYSPTLDSVVRQKRIYAVNLRVNDYARSEYQNEVKHN